MKSWNRILSMCIAIMSVVALAVYAVILDDQKRSLHNQLSGVYEKSFQELMTDMTSLQTKLSKLEAATGSGQYTMLLMDVWRQAGDTESSIAALPVSYQSTSSLTQFMNRTGDYCRYLSKKLAVGEEITAEDMEQIKSLAASCGEISQKIDEIYRAGYVGEFELGSDTFIASGEQTQGNLDFSNQEYPRLQYDGPFSESTENKQPEGLGSEEMSQTSAAQAAAAFMNVEEDTLKPASDLNGRISCYGFSGKQDGMPFEIYVSRQGGQILWFMSRRETGITAAPTDEKYEVLTKVARQFLQEKGYGETEPSYAQFYGGMAVINLAPVEDKIVLYPDLIKVWVDIAKGEVAGMDAYNYLMSHKERELEKPVLSEPQAKGRIHADLEVESVRLALIPLETNIEVLCWEFTGTMDGKDYIIYINAVSGREEDILMIQHTNEGTLVM